MLIKWYKLWVRGHVGCWYWDAEQTRRIRTILLLKCNKSLNISTVLSHKPLSYLPLLFICSLMMFLKWTVLSSLTPMALFYITQILLIEAPKLITQLQNEKSKALQPPQNANKRFLAACLNREASSTLCPISFNAATTIRLCPSSLIASDLQSFRLPQGTASPDSCHPRWLRAQLWTWASPPSRVRRHRHKSESLPLFIYAPKFPLSSVLRYLSLI